MMHLVPYPTGIIREETGTFRMPGTAGAETGGFEAWCLEAFAARVGRPVGGTAWLHLLKNAALPEEGYRLTVSENGVTAEASTERGIVWALTTLASLSDGGRIPCCTIADAPVHEHRGLSLDCVRHFFPAEEVKKIIEEISLAKMNVLHWHLSDDQGWRIESRKFPKLNEVSPQFYTQDEIRQIAEFARVRGVEIVPEIDMPGHTSGLLAAYPQYSCSGRAVTLATAGGIYPVILCAGREETFAFAEELLDEILPLFPGKRFHIGGDEAPKSEWKKCPLCRARMEEQGIDAIEDLQGYFTSRVIGILKKHGKTPVCWNETLLASNVPADIQVQYWTLQHRIPMQRFAENGGKWIYSDMFELYLDYPYSMTSLKKIYETEPHLGKTSFADDPGLLGMEACIWAEHIDSPERLEELLFPRVLAVAELNWSGRRDYGDLKTRLRTVIAGELHKGIHYTPESGWEPKGTSRKKEAIDYFIKVNSMPPEVKAQTVDAAAPNREFASAFMKKFFRPADLPALLIAMFRH